MMTEITKDDCVFSADVEKTKEYYQANSICECDYCQYFHANIRGKYPKTEAFLAEFGIDIAKPDETGPLEHDGRTLYTFVGYTVCGSIPELPEYEIDIDDTTFISICADNGSKFPNRQKGAYFSFTVFGMSLPCIPADEA